MANGVPSIYDIDYSSILGAMGSGAGSQQNLSDIVASLGQTLITGGYMGTNYTGTTWGEGGEGAYGGGWSMPEYGGGLYAEGGEGGWGEGFEYNLPNIMSSMEAYGEEGQDWSSGISQLGDLLQDINMPGLSSTYRQNIGDLNAEISSQVGGLTASLTGGKGGRYGGLGTMARNLEQGGRQQYLSDYYGLQQQQGEKTAQAQQGLTDAFMTAVANWQSMHPA